MYRICVVCTGNICRSPIGEAVLRHRVADAGLADGVEVGSAGTDAWHEGQDADPRARRVLRQAGYRLSHRARQVRRDWFDRHDLFLAMDTGHYEDLLALAPDDGSRAKVRMFLEFAADCAGIAPPDRRLDVPDPYYGRDEHFTDVLALVESAADGIVDHVRAAVA